MANQFGSADYVVFIGTLMVSLSVGIFFALQAQRKRRNSPDDYFLAGRKSSTFPVAVSFVVTFQSSLLLLAFPVEVYAYGMINCLQSVGLFLSFLFAGLFIVPVIYPLKITSVNTYFNLRYGDNLVRYLVVFTGVVYNICYMGTVMFGTCVAAEVIIGIPYWVTVLIFTIVTTIYTSVGGIKAVIWTDVFQFLIMTCGVIAVLITCIIGAGGTSNIAKLANNQLTIDEYSLDPTIRYTVWNTIFGSFTWYFYLCISQSGIQRVSSTPHLRSARLIYILSAPLYAIIVLINGFEGVAIFAYHASKGCDILEGEVVQNVNELLPFTVAQLFKNVPGIKGLFIASLSSGALSTLSSCLSSLSAITYEDMIRVKYPDMADTKATLLSKFTVLVYGLIGMVLTFIIAKLPGSIINIFQGFIGCIDGPTVAVFVLSVLFKRGTSKGIFLGALCGMTVSFWLIMGKTVSSIPADPKLPPGPTDKCWQYANISNPSYNTSGYMYRAATTPTNTTHLLGMSHASDLSPIEKIYTISYILFSLIGFLVTIVFGILISYATKSPGKVDEKYVFNFSKHIMRELFGRSVKSAKRNELAMETTTKDEQSELLNFK